MNYLIIQLFSFLLYSQSGRGGIYRYASTTLLCLLISGFCLSTPAYAACSNPVKDAGDIIYNSDYHVPQYCDGSLWQAMGRAWTGASGGGCTDPVGAEGEFIYNTDYAVVQYCDSNVWRAMGRAVVQLKFEDQPSVDINSTITSNTITLVSTFSDVTATCGAGCTAISINGGAFVAGPVTGVEGGDTIAIRQISSANVATTTTTATVTVGTTTSAVWSVTTYGSGFVEADGTIYVGLSPDDNMPMYTTPCDLGMSGTHGSCTGTRTGYMWGTDGLATGYTSYTTGKLNSSFLVGLYNTYDDGYTVGVPAAQACSDLTFGGNDDWYLPALNELHLFWIGTPAAIGGLNVSGSWYWSSSERLSGSARIQEFDTGVQLFTLKYYGRFVRCVRK